MTTIETEQHPPLPPFPPLALPHGELRLPAYLPDATMGVVRSVDSDDLKSAGVQALVMNVFHLMQKPGVSTIDALGGLHRMAHWDRPIATDSGGFQAYSLIRQHPRLGRISDQGIRFKPEGAEREFKLTPEKSVQLQLAFGADIVICLDDCTHVDDPPEVQEISVQRTIAWASRCRAEFDRQIAQRRRLEGPPPMLFGVIQGGGSMELRLRCAEALLEMEFDGYGYGGWPMDGQGKLLTDMLEYTRSIIPSQFPMHALGVGHPESVAACVRMGYALCDSALPTRDARTGRLYTFTSDPYSTDFDGAGFALEGDWFNVAYIDDEKFTKADRPISPGCRCATCSRYSIGYLRHLRKCGETLFYRLATIHNLHFMMVLMDFLARERE